MNRSNITLFAAVACALGLYFLGTSDRPKATDVQLAVTEAPVEAPTSPEKVVPEKVANTEQAETTVTPQTDEGESPTPETLAFQPPFPDRTNLFQAPKRQGGGRTKSTGVSETTVELLGFVNVNGQRVALSIDGLVTTVAEGDTQYGIEVISIQPPSVVLQRGRQRWQASFEN